MIYHVEITKKEANDFYRQYEHLGNSGLGTCHYGLIINDELTSVVSYGNTCFSSSRGIISVIAVVLFAKSLKLREGKKSKTTLIMRLIGAVCVLIATALILGE